MDTFLNDPLEELGRRAMLPASRSLPTISVHYTRFQFARRWLLFIIARLLGRLHNA